MPEKISIGDALESLAHWNGMLRNGKTYDEEVHVRMRQYRLAVKGWKELSVYVLRQDDFGIIVNDARGSRWMRNHTSDNEVFAEIDANEYERREATRAALTNPDLAKDAWRYACTRSHMPSGTLTPYDAPKSGWVRHAKAS